MSISIDGPKEINDKNRVTHKNIGSFDKVFEGVKKLRRNKIEVGCALVISKSSLGYIDEIYNFMLKNNLPFNVIPLNKSGNAVDNYTDLGLDPDEYYIPWSKLYDKWFYAAPENYIFISDFVRKTQAILAGRAADCLGMSQCGNTTFSVDPIGDVYPCASLSAQPDMKYGNLQNNSILELMTGPRATLYRTRESFDSCQKCKWQHVCHGGCPARAYKYNENNIYNKDYYCPSLYKIYEHIERRLNEKGLTASKLYDKHMSDGLLGTDAFLEVKKHKSKLIEVVNIN
ncbi:MULTISPECIES: radical SAM protein [Photorhabdus]|uniref:SPASM domain-containing protein n=1 Tax=Photorhabdus kayaii TaxID=230088 RepID=A0ABX0B1C8_9GAMM|nr:MULTISPECIES: radical SAM protein [Photorhabdus]MCC8376720.1 radical SAM protein [Photorhabdus bodei]MCT8352773.1 radical SAM protein [Photorhabdus kayaii]MDB6368070.1 radical SAM protein [Photorhabdus bodei]NDL11669.1 SPASM domain-containing protein [Photorhabdus kayaii]NDL25303.1 SPASM domain-containing protein [Photorhabdus kayaii]